MANVIKTVITYPLNGTTKEFNIPFEYLARKFVRVTLIGVDRKVLTLNTDYRFATKTAISTTQAWGPAQGYTQIEIRRYTSATERLVDFTDGSILRAYDLNISQIQTMHVAEEARDLTADTIGVNNDGHLDARGRRIVNVANAVDDRDAVPFGQLKAMNQNAWDSQNKAQQYRNEAETFRNQAETFKSQAENSKNQAAASQVAAKTSETNASTSASSANAHKNAAAASQAAAKTSETNAANSASSSKTQADRAKTEADRAKTEADKLGNWNQLASAVDTVAGTDVKWKGVLRAKGNIHTDGTLLVGSDAIALMKPDELRLKSSNDAARFITMKCFNDTADRKAVLEWGSSVGTGYMMFLERYSYTESRLRVNGVIEATSSISTTGGPVIAKTAHGGLRTEAPNATDPSYVLGKAGGANSWHVGKGSADDNIQLSSHKLGTQLELKADRVAINKYLEIAGQGKVSHDGNVWGSVWGNQWLSGYLTNTFKKKTKAWTVVMDGAAGGGVSKPLSQDVRFRQCWFLINNHWMPVSIGPDATYFVAGWGGGWLKFKISNNGRTFTNIQDATTVPTKITVENE